jgi:hypothetical protein
MHLAIFGKTREIIIKHKVFIYVFFVRLILKMNGKRGVYKDIRTHTL